MSKKQAQVESQDDVDQRLGGEFVETVMEESLGIISPEEAEKALTEMNAEAKAAGLPECDPHAIAQQYASDDDGDALLDELGGED